jgi:hypothetical protein
MDVASSVIITIRIASARYSAGVEDDAFRP